MSWMPGAIQRPLSKNHTPVARQRRDGIVLHTAASSADGYAHWRYWNRDANAAASATFYVDWDGTITQYMPIEHISWASAMGNWRTCSVETQGQGADAWTDAQVESLAQIIAWASSVEGWPLRLMASTSRSERGVGWHSIAYGGERWNPHAHDCPGPRRVAQIPTVLARARAIAGGAPTSEAAEKNTKRKKENNMRLVKYTAPWDIEGYTLITDVDGAEALDSMTAQAYNLELGGFTEFKKEHWDLYQLTVRKAWERHAAHWEALGRAVSEPVEDAVKRVIAAARGEVA